MGRISADDFILGAPAKVSRFSKFSRCSFAVVARFDGRAMNLPAADTSPKINTLDEAEAAGAIVAELDIQIKQATIRKNLLEAAANRRGKRIKELEQGREKQAGRLCEWCEENPTVMNGSQSLELRQVKLSFRQGNRFVKLLAGWSDALVLKAMRRRKRFSDCIRVRTEIDKQMVLRKTVRAQDLKAVGIEIARARYFYCESKLS